MEKQWYESWFDSPYYHLLYKKRDEREAKGFIDKLITHLSPDRTSRMMDIACGKGRFSRYLADKGFEVTGIDLSVNSINFARQFERENLSFFTQDMRKVFRVNYFDFVFSFFTSFGYFESDNEDLKSLISIAKGLKQGGVFVLDFFNTEYVLKNLVTKESKIIENTEFDIHRWIEEPYVFKKISLEVEGHPYSFTERVRLFRLEDFERLFDKAGMKIVRIFGDYELADFDHENSSRMILIVKK